MLQEQQQQGEQQRNVHVTRRAPPLMTLGEGRIRMTYAYMPNHLPRTISPTVEGLAR